MFFYNVIVLVVAIFCATTSVRAQVHVDVAVEEHNSWRNLHGSPHVTSSSSDINEFAQEWADYLSLTDQFYHSGGPFGENLYKVWGGSSDQNVIVANAIRSWYSEIQYYDWNNPGFSSQTGHFTQVVWRSSIEIGVGVHTVPDPTYGIRTVVCVNYRPPGNFLNQFAENVLPPLTQLDSIFNKLNTTISNDEPYKIMIL